MMMMTMTIIGLIIMLLISMMLNVYIAAILRTNRVNLSEPNTHQDTKGNRQEARLPAATTASCLVAWLLGCLVAYEASALGGRQG